MTPFRGDTGAGSREWEAEGGTCASGAATTAGTGIRAGIGAGRAGGT